MERQFRELDFPLATKYGNKSILLAGIDPFEAPKHQRV
jgi:hypothetical protein